VFFEDGQRLMNKSLVGPDYWYDHSFKEVHMTCPTSSPTILAQREEFRVNYNIIVGVIIIGIVVLFGCACLHHYQTKLRNAGTRIQHHDNLNANLANQNSTNDGHNEEQHQNHVVFNSSQQDNDFSTEQQQNNRRFAILTNLIHKKVVSKKKVDYEPDHIDIPAAMSDDHEQIQFGNSEIDENEDIDIQEISSLTSIFPIPFPQSKRDLKDDIHVESIRSIRNAMFTILPQEESNRSTLNSPRTCPICIEPYKVGDDIVWSKNEECPHAFHLDCILSWLMENDDCPICRRDYLLLQRSEV
jgi:flagellar basal body rod protein FlgC